MLSLLSSFFFNDTETSDIYTYAPTLSLHDALPICGGSGGVNSTGGGAAGDSGAGGPAGGVSAGAASAGGGSAGPASSRSEEHTSELQSLMRSSYAVFCLKKKKKHIKYNQKCQH